MMSSAAPACRRSSPAASRRRRLVAGLLTLALALPALAHSYTLNELLEMPLERLLQLEISPRLSALAIARGAPTGSRCRVDGSLHAA